MSGYCPSKLTFDNAVSFLSVGLPALLLVNTIIFYPFVRPASRSNVFFILFVNIVIFCRRDFLATDLYFDVTLFFLFNSLFLINVSRNHGKVIWLFYVLNFYVQCGNSSKLFNIHYRKLPLCNIFIFRVGTSRC